MRWGMRELDPWWQLPPDQDHHHLDKYGWIISYECVLQKDGVFSVAWVNRGVPVCSKRLGEATWLRKKMGCVHELGGVVFKAAGRASVMVLAWVGIPALASAVVVVGIVAGAVVTRFNCCAGCAETRAMSAVATARSENESCIFSEWQWCEEYEGEVLRRRGAWNVLWGGTSTAAATRLILRADSLFIRPSSFPFSLSARIFLFSTTYFRAWNTVPTVLDELLWLTDLPKSIYSDMDG